MWNSSVYCRSNEVAWESFIHLFSTYSSNTCYNHQKQSSLTKICFPDLGNLLQFSVRNCENIAEIDNCIKSKWQEQKMTTTPAAGKWRQGYSRAPCICKLPKGRRQFRTSARVAVCRPGCPPDPSTGRALVQLTRIPRLGVLWQEIRDCVGPPGRLGCILEARHAGGESEKCKNAPEVSGQCQMQEASGGPEGQGLQSLQMLWESSPAFLPNECPPC
jgi:hypothetical protein